MRERTDGEGSWISRGARSLGKRRTRGRVGAGDAADLRPARSPSVSVSLDPGDEEDNVIRVYGSDGCPVAWRLRVALLYKAAAPIHFTPSEAA
ncbi:hypothetical protein ACUV84_032817 [Puccinellia chinampoensis]